MKVRKISHKLFSAINFTILNQIKSNLAQIVEEEKSIPKFQGENSTFCSDQWRLPLISGNSLGSGLWPMGAMLCGVATASKTTKLRKGGSDCSRFEVGGFWRRWVKWKIMRIYIVNDKFSLAPDILIYTLQSLGTSQLTLIFL